MVTLTAFILLRRSDANRDEIKIIKFSIEFIYKKNRYKIKLNVLDK